MAHSRVDEHGVSCCVICEISSKKKVEGQWAFFMSFPQPTLVCPKCYDPKQTDDYYCSLQYSAL